jgi:hypothetical protein
LEELKPDDRIDREDHDVALRGIRVKRISAESFRAIGGFVRSDLGPDIETGRKPVL